MKVIKTKIIEIGREKRVALYFGYNKEIIEKIKHIKGRKWSATDKFWHIPFLKDQLQILNERFKEQLEFVETETDKQIFRTKSAFPQEYLETLKLKNYSEPTIKTYRLHFQRFLNFFKIRNRLACRMKM